MDSALITAPQIKNVLECLVKAKRTTLPGRPASVAVATDPSELHVTGRTEILLHNLRVALRQGVPEGALREQ